VLSSLPDATLLNLGLDRDMLLAGVCAIVVSPASYDLFMK
jgi:hypothetical protein